MSADVSTKPRHRWPFISPIAMTTTNPTEILRQRALERLAQEGRAIHTGTLAAQLGVPTHQVQLALHHPHQTGKVRFTSSDGWELMPAAEKTVHEGQGRLA
jgi:hypothetical protein